MAATVSPLPDDVEALKAALTTARAELAVAKAKATDDEALIAHLKLMSAKLRRDRFGPSAERSRRLLDQMELQFEELEASASEDALAAEAAAAKTATPVTGFTRKRPSRQPFPEHLPRERVVVPAPCACAACGGTRLSKLGEDVTETLEVIPHQWKVVQTVRERFSCRDCERISQPPAPFHVTPRGWAGPNDEGALNYFIGSQMDVTNGASRAALERAASARARLSLLTQRQREVLQQMAPGLRNKLIAAALGINEKTVKMHRAALLARLEAETSADAVRLAVEAGL